MESTKQNATHTFQVAAVVSFYMGAALVVREHIAILSGSNIYLLAS